MKLKRERGGRELRLSKKPRLLAAVLAVLLLVLAAPPLLAADFLWRVASETGGRAYILGSIHLAHEGLYPLSAPIMEAFGRSGQLAVELDVESLGQATLSDYVAKHGLAAGGRFEERLSPQTREILEQSAVETELFQPLKPWLAALTLQVDFMRQYGYDAEYGLDRFFLRQARARGLEILELETLDDQMGPLAGMSDAESDLFFRATLLELNDLPQVMDDMFAAWRGGDAKGFGEIFFQEYDKYPELVPILDKVVFRRNERLAARIEELLSPDGEEPLFIVIGAGHLVGPGGVLELLAEKFSVDQL